jgi:hypothetical protein
LAFSNYIYYRVVEPAEAAVTVRKLQSAIHERLGVAGRVLNKRDEPSMWMEIYEGVSEPAEFEAVLAGLLEGAGFDAVLAAGSSRKTECFEDR